MRFHWNLGVVDKELHLIGAFVVGSLSGCGENRVRRFAFVEFKTPFRAKGCYVVDRFL